MRTNNPLRLKQTLSSLLRGERYLLFPVVRIPIDFGPRTHQNRSLGHEQLDDGIVDTLVLAQRHITIGATQA
jgi:hypothetical protein